VIDKEIKLTHRQSWLIGYYARYKKYAREDVNYIEELKKGDNGLEDIAYYYLGQKKKEEIDPIIWEIIEALDEWVERNTV
jgi:hypothetical protein